MMVNFLGFDLFILVLLLSVPGAPWAFSFFTRTNKVALSRTSGHLFGNLGTIRSSAGHNFARRASGDAAVGHYESSKEVGLCTLFLLVLLRATQTLIVSMMCLSRFVILEI
jgi:hypothetical protein